MQTILFLELLHICFYRKVNGINMRNNEKIKELAEMIKSDCRVISDRKNGFFGSLTAYLNKQYSKCPLAEEICDNISRINIHFDYDIYISADSNCLEISIRELIRNEINNCTDYTFTW